MQAYETANLPLAAYLVVEGFPLKGVDGPNHLKTFRFEPHDDLSEKEFEFVNRRARVEPGEYLEQVRNLRRLSVRS